MTQVRRLPVVLLPLAITVAASAPCHLACGGGGTIKPSPSPTLAPSPAPSDEGSKWSSTCALGNGSASFNCEKTSSRLSQQVEDAMDRLIAARPEIFDISRGEYSPEMRDYYVLDQDAYMNGLASELQAVSLCAEVDIYAEYGTRDVIFVKESNDFSEEFDVLTEKGFMRRGKGSYRTSCTPAAFPFELTADVPPADSGCYRPFPPPIDAMSCKQHTYIDGHQNIDSTPQIRDSIYCEAIRYPPGAGQCPIRPEGAVDRVACENWRAGTAKDTGRPGPTWTKLANVQDPEGSYCKGRESNGCQNSEGSQYELWVWDPGIYKVCAKTGDCCHQAYP
jgi:hypothetical protein